MSRRADAGREGCAEPGDLGVAGKGEKPARCTRSLRRDCRREMRSRSAEVCPVRVLGDASMTSRVPPPVSGVRITSTSESAGET